MPGMSRAFGDRSRISQAKTGGGLYSTCSGSVGWSTHSWRQEIREIFKKLSVFADLSGFRKGDKKSTKSQRMLTSWISQKVGWSDPVSAAVSGFRGFENVDLLLSTPTKA